MDNVIWAAIIAASGVLLGTVLGAGISYFAQAWLLKKQREWETIKHWREIQIQNLTKTSDGFIKFSESTTKYFLGLMPKHDFMVEYTTIRSWLETCLYEDISKWGYQLWELIVDCDKSKTDGESVDEINKKLDVISQRNKIIQTLIREEILKTFTQNIDSSS